MDLVSKTIQFIEQYHASDHSGHGTDHIMRVFHTARQLAEACEEPVDELVLQLAALLHDVDDHKINPTGGAARKFLESIQTDSHIVETVLDTISPISFSVSGPHPHFETIEQKLLSDADKLDAIGSIGICRTIAYGTAHHRPLYGEPGKDTLSHFYDKLLLLKDSMQTDAGRIEAERRHQTMETFLNEFYLETGEKERITTK